MKHALTVLALGAAFAASATIAKADQINGGMNVTGNSIYNATTQTVTFPAPGTVTPDGTVAYSLSAASNDFFSAGFTSPVALNCLSPTNCWNLAGAGPIPLGTAGGTVNMPPSPLLVFTATSGTGNKATFTLTSESYMVTTSNIMGITYYDVDVDGTGMFTLTGFDPTPGSFNFTINENSGQVVGSFSGQGFAVPPSATPEPGSLALLGTGLLGVAAIGRRRFTGRFSA